MRVEGHTVALGAFEPQQGDVVLPALALILSVDDDAFGRQGAFEVVLLLGVVVAQAQDVARRVPAKSGGARKRCCFDQVLH